MDVVFFALHAAIWLKEANDSALMSLIKENEPFPSNPSTVRRSEWDQQCSQAEDDVMISVSKDYKSILQKKGVILLQDNEFVHCSEPGVFVWEIGQGHHFLAIWSGMLHGQVHRIILDDTAKLTKGQLSSKFPGASIACILLSQMPESLIRYSLARRIIRYYVASKENQTKLYYDLEKLEKLQLLSSWASLKDDYMELDTFYKKKEEAEIFKKADGSYDESRYNGLLRPVFRDGKCWIVKLGLDDSEEK